MPTILVVDDEPAIRTMIALALERQGFAVLTAGGGEQALSLWRTCGSTIDLLVSDVCMPEMDGPTLVQRLLAENARLPVLFMSGSCDSKQLEASRPFNFLPKPLSLPVL